MEGRSSQHTKAKAERAPFWRPSSRKPASRFPPGGVSARCFVGRLSGTIGRSSATLNTAAQPRAIHLPLVGGVMHLTYRETDGHTSPDRPLPERVCPQLSLQA